MIPSGGGSSGGGCRNLFSNGEIRTSPKGVIAAAIKTTIAARAIIRPVRTKRPFDPRTPSRAVIKRTEIGESKIQKILEATKNKKYSLEGSGAAIMLDLRGHMFPQHIRVSWEKLHFGGSGLGCTAPLAGF
jgi:hypothetical protein